MILREQLHLLLQKVLQAIVNQEVPSSGEAQAIAKFLETLPMDLENAAQGETTYDEVVANLRAKDPGTRAHHWVVDTIDNNLSRDLLDGKSFAYRFLYLVLIDMRASAYLAKNDALFRLLDTFHTVPLALNRASEGKETYESILASIRERATRNACETWVERALAADG